MFRLQIHSRFVDIAMADTQNICEKRIILIPHGADLTPDVGIVSQPAIGIRVALEISPSHMEHCCARHPPYVRRNEISETAT